MKKAPDAFRTISEVSDWLETPAHVLRFWESKFSQIKPVKRAGGRRYYRPDDMRLLGGIKQMLHIDGLTIKGAQKVLREKGVKHVATLSPVITDTKEKSPIDTLTDEISKNVVAVASTPSAPPAPLVLEPENRTTPSPQEDKVAEMSSADTPQDSAEPQNLATEPVVDSTSAAEPKSEDISQLYGRLKSLRRRMKDAQ